MSLICVNDVLSGKYPDDFVFVSCDSFENIESQLIEARDKIQFLEKQVEALNNLMSLSKEIICGLYPDEDDCRYDHNRNCQEHGWFGLDGEDCPVSQYKKTLKQIEEME